MTAAWTADARTSARGVSGEAEKENGDGTGQTARSTDRTAENRPVDCPRTHSSSSSSSKSSSTGSRSPFLIQFALPARTSPLLTVS